MSVVKLIWKCSKPRNKNVVQLCESLMTAAAEANGMDTAIIRHGPHDTTRIMGVYQKTSPHITGDIVNTRFNKGFALHWNLDSTWATTLPSSTGSPNPELWELVHKAGKGFVVVGDPTEAVHDVEDE